MPKKRYEELMAQEEREREQIRKLVDDTTYRRVRLCG
jgi:hypothetical protein